MIAHRRSSANRNYTYESLINVLRAALHRSATCGPARPAASSTCVLPNLRPLACIDRARHRRTLPDRVERRLPSAEIGALGRYRSLRLARARCWIATSARLYAVHFASAAQAVTLGANLAGRPPGMGSYAMAIAPQAHGRAPGAGHLADSPGISAPCSHREPKQAHPGVSIPPAISKRLTG
jgi:hypothetical protein